MGTKIEIGYLKFLPRFQGISARLIENNFLNLLGRYANIRITPLRKINDIEETLKRIEEYKLDYLYISSFISDFGYLKVLFWAREKLGINIPFIFYIHAVFPWFDSFVYAIPFLRNYDKIFAPSEYAKSSFLKLSPKFDVHVIPYCIDLNLIQRNLSTNIKKNKKIITFMGRLIPKKGVGVLIESLPKIIAKIDNAHLNIIGPLSGGGIKNSPKSTYVKKIEKLVRQHKLTNRVTFKGVRLGLNKYKILSESDIFVNPTLAEEETLGIVNIEALACGVPVITTYWGGSREIIKNDKNGYLLEIHRDKKNKPYFDHNQLVSLIIKVLGNKNLNLKLKKNAMMSVEKYDYHIIMPHFVSLLKKRKANIDIASRWDFFKDKMPTDFGYIFNDEFLFFLFLEKNFKAYTFSTFYNRVINNYAGKSISLKKSSKEGVKMKSHESHIIRKIRKDFFYYLTSN